MTVSKVLLQSAISTAETTQSYPTSDALFKEVAKSRFAQKNNLNASQLLQLAIEHGCTSKSVSEFKKSELTERKPRGTKGRVKLEIDEAKFREVIAEVESKGEFTKLGDLWNAVAETEWAKSLKPRPLTPSVVYQRVQQFGIKTNIASSGKKGRVKLEVDEDELRNVISEIESKKTFTKLSDLWDAVAETDWAKDMKPRPLTPATIYQRVQEYGIETGIVTSGKRGRAKLEVDEDELRNVISEIESKKTFTKLSDLWDAVAKTDWAKDMEPRPLTPATIYQRVEEYGIETITKPARTFNRTSNMLKVDEDDDTTVQTKVTEVRQNFYVNDTLNKFNAGIPRYSGMSMTVIPAGGCPFKLTGTDEKTVEDWGKKIISTFKSQRQQLAPSALVYFAREFYDIFSTEFKVVEENILSCKHKIYGSFHEMNDEDQND